MDYTKIILRSFEVVRKYRALWLFGVLLALFGGSGGGGGGGGFPGGAGSGGDGRSRGGDTLPNQFPQFGQIDWTALWTIITIVVCVILTLIIVGTVLRFISRAALIGLVNELETNQTAPTVGRGFRIGLDYFWRLLGIAILINLPFALIALLMLGVAILPFIGALSASGRSMRGFEDVFAFASAGSITLLCCVILAIVVLTLIIRPIYEFIVRECIIGNRGAVDSIREGWRLVRANLGSVVVLYILTIAIGIGIGIAMIPVVLILIGIPIVAGFAFYLAMNAVAPALIAGAVLGVPMLAILIFLSGLVAAFEYTLWTEGYLAVAQGRGAPTPTSA